MPILWTFENPDKLKPFTVVLKLLTQSGTVYEI